MPMEQLVEFVRSHSDRAYADKPSPWEVGAFRPATADLVFFEVYSKGEPDAETLRRLIAENYKGCFGDLNPLDGNEHSFIEIGGWIGDQGLALQLMGLGQLLGLWGLMTPKMLAIPDHIVKGMAGMGYVSIMPV